jgi:HEAT repeat protein
MRREYFGTGDIVRSMFGFDFKKKVAALEQEYRTASLERRREIASQMHTLCAESKKPDAALPLLEVMLRDPDPDIGEAATYGMGHGKKAGLVRLQQLLDDPSDAVRERACHAIANMQGKAAPALPGLLAALSDTAPGVRGRAAFALGQVPDTSTSTVDALARLARDPDSTPRHFALHALGRIGREGGARGVGAHRAMILESVKDVSDEVRWSACYALQTTDPRGTKAFEVLIEALRVEDTPRTQQEIAGTLFWVAKGEDLAAHFPQMLEIAQTTPAARPTIFSLCSSLGTRAAALAPLIRESLSGDDAMTAIRTLRDITGSDTEILPALERVLEQGKFQQRFDAAAEWMKLTGRVDQVIPMLEWALGESPDEPGMFIQQVGTPLVAVAPALARSMEDNFDEPDWDVMWNLTCAMAEL